MKYLASEIVWTKRYIYNGALGMKDTYIKVLFFERHISHCFCVKYMYIKELLSERYIYIYIYIYIYGIG
jgi:hypothetical protein